MEAIKGKQKTESKKGKKRALRKKEMDSYPSHVGEGDAMFEIGENSIASRGADKNIVAADKFAQAKKAEAKMQRTAQRLLLGEHNARKRQSQKINCRRRRIS